MNCSFVFTAGYGEFIIGSPYYSSTACQKVFDVGGVPVSAAKVDFSSPELVREVTSFSISLVEILTTFLEDALALPFDFCL